MNIYSYSVNNSIAGSYTINRKVADNYMKKIKLGSKNHLKKRSLSSYASFALFVAAAAIALSAMILRLGKDRLTDPEDEELASLPQRQTVSTESASQQNDAGSTTSSPAKNKSTDSTTKSTQPTLKKTADDEFDDREDSEETTAIQVMGNSRSYVRPSGGAIIKPCSIRALAYSRTMKDWRVHSGLDIAAEKGEIVKSASEGKVTDVMNDALYGTTVVVNQNDGLMVYYRGLNRETAVRAGEDIAAGATIGTVGDIPCEAADGIHLHIEVTSENKYLDPCEALGIK